MCGIIGYVGTRPCRDILFQGLRKLEYRGYDSAGISIVRDGRFKLLHSVGNLDNLEEILDRVGGGGTMGIAHTRWATHGRPSDENAHPHTDCNGRFAIVLNGIVENYLSLRAASCRSEGHGFTSETDAEVVAHLIERAYDGSLREAMVAAYRQMEGHFTYCAIAVDEPDVIVGVRKETPLVVGLGRRRELPGFGHPGLHGRDPHGHLPRRWGRGGDHQDAVEIFTLDGDPVACEWTHVDWDEEAAEKGGFETFMLKEIHEQPTSLADTLAERIGPDGGISLDGLGLTPETIRGLRQVLIVACGTSYHAGLVGKYALERWARMPVEVEVASEFRYRDPVIEDGTLCIAISQSGETADTLAAMRLARSAGARVLAVTNIVGSQATREADGVLFTRAGLEIGVAATKTFLTQEMAMLLLALHFGEVRGRLGEDQVRTYTEELRRVPGLLDDYLAERCGRKGGRGRAQIRRQPLLPLSWAEHGTARRSGGRSQAQGDLLHPHGRVRGGRDEARSHRAAGGRLAGPGRGHRQFGVRQAHLQRPGGQGAGRPDHRRGIRGQPEHRGHGR